MVSLEEAIPIVVARAAFDPAMRNSDAFRSVEALTLACDPVALGVVAAAHNRVATRRCATTGEWSSNYPDDVAAELAELEAAGFKRPTCANGTCGLPAKRAMTPEQTTERSRCAGNGPVKVPVRDDLTVEQALTRIGELAQPGVLGCLFRTSFWRLSIIAVASDPTHGLDVMIDEVDITREARALEAAYPKLHICCDHRAKMAEIEAAVAAGTYA